MGMALVAVMSFSAATVRAEIIDIADELLGKAVEKVLEVSVLKSTVALNDYTHDPYTGALLYILPGHKLRELASQAEETQVMITGLQQQVSALEDDIDDKFDVLIDATKLADFNTALKVLTDDNTTLAKTLDLKYARVMAIVTNCVTYETVFTNGAWVTNQVVGELTEAQQGYIDSFATDDQMKNGFPQQVLIHVQEQTNPEYGTSIYDKYYALLSCEVPFRHQTYGNMYALYNFIQSLSTKAFTYEKEYWSYQFYTNVATAVTNNAATVATNYVAWLEQNNVLDHGAELASGMSWDITNNVVLAEMAALLPDSYIGSNAEQRLNYLAGTIETNYPFPGGTRPVYKVTCNADYRSYLISIVPRVIDVSEWNDGTSSDYYCELDDVPDAWTSDGRYRCARTDTEIVNLFSLDKHNAPYDFLAGTSGGGLIDLQLADGIRLYKTVPEDHDTLFSQIHDIRMYLLDANDFSLAKLSEEQYLQVDSRDVRATDIYDCLTGNSATYEFANKQVKPLSQALFMDIYCDVLIDPGSRNGTDSYCYHPTSATDIPDAFRLADGDTADLSSLSGNVPTEIRTCGGEATIIGGGDMKTMTGCSITTYGGQLVISNLWLKCVDKGQILSNTYAPLNLVAMGANCLTGCVDVPLTTDQDLTISGPGTLTVQGPGVPAVSAAYGANIIVSDASNLVVTSRGATTMQAGSGRIEILNSKVTSEAGQESDVEFDTSATVISNGMMNMSWGILDPVIVTNCTWLGMVRGQSAVSVQTANIKDAGTDCNIWLKIGGACQTTDYINIKDLATTSGYDPFEKDDLDQFNMSYSTTNRELGSIQKIWIKTDTAGSDSDWQCDYVTLATTDVDGAPARYYFAVNHKFSGDQQGPLDVATVNGWAWSVNPDDTCTITNYYTDSAHSTGPCPSVTVPTALDGHPVRGLGDSLFNGFTWMTSISIPAGVTSIGDHAFEYSGLTGITLPPGITSIGNWSFHYCSGLTGITLPSGVTSIGDYAFNRCLGLQNLALPVGVTNIGYGAFDNCTALRSFSIPGSVVSIQDYAFAGCGQARLYFRGDAPSLGGSDVFLNAGSAVIYHLPYAHGWESGLLGGQPTAAWGPRVLADGNLGMAGNRFGFNIAGASNMDVVVEACTDLSAANWTNLITVTLTGGASYFSDPGCTNQPVRFYHLTMP